MNCLYCNKALDKQRSTAKYCSDAHKKAYLRKIVSGTKEIEKIENVESLAGQNLTGTEVSGTSKEPEQVETNHPHGAGTWYVANCPLCFADILIESERLRQGWV